MRKPLRSQALTLVGKNWSKSSLTREKQLGTLTRLADRIEDKFGLENLQNLKTKHLAAVFLDFQKDGLSPSTISGYLTAARQIADGIGKSNIVPRDNTAWGGSRGGIRYCPRQGDRERIQQVREGLYARAQWLGLAHDLREAFGLRAKESLLSTRTVERDGNLYLQIDGTKGGRPRELAVDNVAKAEALGRVQEYLRENGQKTLIPADKTLKQGYDIQKNELTRLGATKDNQANSHLARHAIAQRMTAEGKEDQEIAEHLGHGRSEVVKHYR